MTKIRFQKTKYLIIALVLLLLTSLCGGISSVFAAMDSVQATQTITDKYNEVKGTTYYIEYDQDYNVLNGIKSYADYKISTNNFTDDDVNGYVSQMQSLLDIVNHGERVKMQVSGLTQGNYAGSDWQKILAYQSDAIKDIKELLASNDINVNSAKQIADTAISNILAVEEMPGTANIDNDRNNASIDMKNKLDEYQGKFYYSENAKQEMQDLYDAKLLELNQASSVTKFEEIKKVFLDQIKLVKNIVNETYNKKVLDETYVWTLEEIRDAIAIYNAMPEDVKNQTNTNADATALRNDYINQMINTLTWEDERKYSTNNKGLIYQEISKAKSDCKNYTTTNQIDVRISQAKTYIDGVELNVNTITTKVGKYKVTVSVDKDYYFSPNAYVTCKDYEYFPVKTNLNRLLAKIENIDRVGGVENVKDYGKNAKYCVKYYLSIKIFDENITGKLREVKDFTDGTVFTVKIENDKLVNKLKDNCLVTYYYDGDLDGYEKGKTMSDVYNARIVDEAGGKVLVFETTHFSNYAFCGLTTRLFGDTPFYKHPLFYLICGVGLIVVYLVVLIMLKTWKYKVKFIADPKNKKLNSVAKAKKGGFFPMPPTPSKPGFLFAGWFTDKNLTNRFIQVKIDRRTNLKVYAKWTPLVEGEKITVIDLYQALKCALADYKKTGINVGFVESEEVARLMISRDRIYLYLTGEVEKYKSLGYDVSVATDEELTNTPVKFVVSDEETLNKGLELIDLVMVEKGMTEDEEGEPTVEEVKDDEIENGYVFVINYEKVAQNLDDWFNLIRADSKSYVLEGNCGTPRDLDGKYIVKAKKFEDRIDLYLPYDDGTADKVVDALYKDVPYLYRIESVEDVQKALATLKTSMESIGMKKYPKNASLLRASEEGQTAFGYKIKFN